MGRTVAPCIAKNFNTTFLSCEKDQETIWRKLFAESKPYSDMLKRLLVINTKDCLDDSKYQYRQIIESTTISDLMEKKYIRIIPKLDFGEHEEVKSYIILDFDDFFPTSNPEFRDCTVSFGIICHFDYWGLEDYKLRPYQIAGYIDGILNHARLSGIGTLEFIGAKKIILNEYLGGLDLMYKATHGTDDSISPELQMTGKLNEL